MVLSLFGGGSGGASVSDLIARKRYDKAVELLRAEFKQGSRDPRLRLQLADVLVLAGKGKDAIPILLGLADEFALEGYAAKAISVLKKVQKIAPERNDINSKLAKLIKEKHRDSPTTASTRPTTGAFDMEEIGLAVAVASAPAVPTEPAPAEALDPVALQRFQEAAHSIALPEAQSSEPLAPLEALGDDLLSVIEDVLRTSPPAAAQSGRAASQAAVAFESPLFTSFSEDELVAVIQGLRLLSFEPGDIVITEGEKGDSLFVLTTGWVKAFVRDPNGKSIQVREMTEGAFFGEISILSGKPRTATVTAKTACELLELDRNTLDTITKTHPNVWIVLKKFYEERSRNAAEQKIRSGQG